MKALSLLLAALAVSSLALAQPAPEPVLVVGQVHWPGHDLTNSQVRVFRDKERRDPVGAFPTLDGSGRCLLPLQPGEYYLTAVVDLNGDQKLGPGDGLGFYGVTDPTTSEPQPLKVTADTAAALLLISLEMNPEGKLQATGVTAPEPNLADRLLTMTGRVSGLAEAGAAYVYLVPQGGGPCSAAAVSPAAPAFTFTVPGGVYYLFAVQDANADERVGPGDLVAVAGYAPEQGATFPTVEFKQSPPEATLVLQWRIGPDGLLRAREGEGTGPQMALGTLPAVLRVTISNLPAPETAGRLTAFRDPQLKDPAGVGEFRGSPGVLCLPTGTYFVTVLADLDTNLQASPGDLLGFHGVADLLKSHGPQPVYLRPGELRSAEIALTAKLNAAAKPEPLPAPEK